MEDVLQMMMVLSIRDRPVFGSVSSGNSFRTSTTSPARSPHAATITISTSEFFACMCWSTVLPAPNGPGVQKVPPFATGRKESMQRIFVTSGSFGRSLSA